MRPWPAAELSAKLDDGDKERATLLRSKEALNAAIADLTSRLEEHGRNVLQGAADRKRLQSEVKDLQAKLEQERFAKGELERSLSKAAASTEALKERLVSADAARLASERAHGVTKGDLEHLEAQLGQETRERTRLETENRELATEADQLREKIDAQLEVRECVWWWWWEGGGRAPGILGCVFALPTRTWLTLVHERCGERGHGDGADVFVPLTRTGTCRAARAEAHAKGRAGRVAYANGRPTPGQRGSRRPVSWRACSVAVGTLTEGWLAVWPSAPAYRMQAELETLRVRHAKELLDLKAVIAERDDRLNDTRENAVALEGDVNTVRWRHAARRGCSGHLFHGRSAMVLLWLTAWRRMGCHEAFPSRNNSSRASWRKKPRRMRSWASAWSGSRRGSPTCKRHWRPRTWPKSMQRTAAGR